MNDDTRTERQKHVREWVKARGMVWQDGRNTELSHVHACAATKKY